MKNVLKWFLLALPLVAVGVAIVMYSYQTARIERQIRDVDGMILGSGENILVVRMSRSIENEVATDTITIKDQDGNIVLESVVRMDHDLFGTGLVKAIQADDDPELEVVVWGNNFREGESFFLDFVGGKVEKRSFDEVSDRVKRFIDDYRQVYTLYPVIFGFLLVSFPIYYILYFVVYLFFRKPRQNEQV